MGITFPSLSYATHVAIKASAASVVVASKDLPLRAMPDNDLATLST